MDSKARHRLLSTVDRLLLERGELDPLEYLLAIGGVDYADYREWRHRRRPVLQSALRLPVEEVTAALAHAPAYAIEQRLSRSEEHTSELQSRFDLVCRLLLEKKKKKKKI